jgi:hypothetical protein
MSEARPIAMNCARGLSALAGVMLAGIVVSANGSLGVCRVASGATTVPLIELYTSEGCDSCPPADRWLSANFPRTGSATRPLALAFHVDYWDRLGWIDRFGSHEWTDRQYTAMRANGGTFVVTPQVLLQGHEFPAGRRGMPKSALERVARERAAATIELTAVTEGADVVATAASRVADPVARERATLSIAYVDSGLVSDVKAGENRGVQLTHDHVVRALKTAPSTGDQSNFSARFTKPAEAGVAPTLVAIVQNAATGDVLQALALPLSDCHP